MASRLVPDFLIVGAPKAGTTSLYHSLDRHPQIYMSPIKEPNYFASEVRPENFSEEWRPQVAQDQLALADYLRGPMREKRFGGIVTKWQDYQKLFADVKDEVAAGEASVSYLWSRTAAANIQSRVPGAKIIVILRNPADRAFSQYLHAVTNGVVRWTFRQHIDASLRRTTDQFCASYPFLEYGLYYEQVKRYLDNFPPEQVRIYWYDDYKNNGRQLLADVLTFLGADATLAPDLPEKHLEPRISRFPVASRLLKNSGIWQAARRLAPRGARQFLRGVVFKSRNSLVMDARDREYLVNYYREDVRKLSMLLNRDLSGWLRSHETS